MYVWVMLAVGLLAMLIGFVGLLLSHRNWPVCPVHHKRMELIGDCYDGYHGGIDEFVCQVPDCNQCADVLEDGTVRYFEA